MSGRKGDRAPFVPKWTYNASIDYTRRITPNLEGFFFLSYQHVGDRNTRFNPTVSAARHLADYQVLQGRLGIGGDSWLFEVFGENLTNARGKIDQRFNPFTLTPAEFTSVIHPRTLGLSLTVRY